MILKWSRHSYLVTLSFFSFFFFLTEVQLIYNVASILSEINCSRENARVWKNWEKSSKYVLVP